MPQPHSSCSFSTVYKHRRPIEDKVIAILGSKLTSESIYSQLLDITQMPFVAKAYITLIRPWVAFSGPAFQGFDVHEVALSYNISSHQGDRRKTSQHCTVVGNPFWNQNMLSANPHLEKHVDFGPGIFALFSGHKVNEFSKSRASLGSITAVDRSRVSELQNPEEDKPLAAHWRVV